MVEECVKRKVMGDEILFLKERGKNFIEAPSFCSPSPLFFWYRSYEKCISIIFRKFCSYFIENTLLVL
jgi:hypothetical protein